MPPTRRADRADEACEIFREGFLNRLFERDGGIGGHRLGVRKQRQ